MPGSPLTYKGQNIFKSVAPGSYDHLLRLSAVLSGERLCLFYLMLILAFYFWRFCSSLPIWRCRYAGRYSLTELLLPAWAAAATGMVIGNNVLIIAGTLDGGSGFILSIVMCKAMNRSITKCPIWRVRQRFSETTQSSEGQMREIGLDDVAGPTGLCAAGGFRARLRYGDCASATCFYGKLADALEHRGVNGEVCYSPSGWPNAWGT